MTLHRRGFLGAAAASAAGTAMAASAKKTVALVLDPADKAANGAAWAVSDLGILLKQLGFRVQSCARIADAAAGALPILATGDAALLGGVPAPAGPEAFAIAQSQVGGRKALVVCGDARGIAYGILELADRARHGERLAQIAPLAEQPANPVRSVMRTFTCEVYDKPWFYDRTQWRSYCGMLASHRFNRLNLSFGLAYDSLKNVRDSYFLFLYPFLLDVPGYKVRVTDLADAERERNLDTLKFISETAAAHGLDFELGIWTHGYEWPSVPGVATIEGLTPETQAAYCHDALLMLLNQLPAVSALGLRIHGESGVKEGSYGFWKTVFSAVPKTGRKIEIDIHAKGIDKTMLDNALATGMPVNVSPKYWGEHLGMPYHQAAIREWDMPKPGQVGRGLMTLSEGQRSFTRYGYADLLREDRAYTVRHRIFPGTRRVLMSAAAVADAAYGRVFGFCGSTGADWMEPLTYRGRRGSSAGDPRSGYVAKRLGADYDWRKYEDWYRAAGRGLYAPDGVAESLGRAFGKNRSLEAALAAAGRILPIVTTAHAPSAACDCYWPEVYWNQPMSAEPDPNPYRDTFAPRVFQNASPLDPQLFSSMDGFAADMLSGSRSPKYTPLEAAAWVEHYAAEAERSLKRARPRSVDETRLAIDIAVQAGLGRFFAAKFRAGVLYAIYEKSGDAKALSRALMQYRRVRAAWAKLADRAKGVYGDLSSSDTVTDQGTWSDRLAAIDADIAALVQKLPDARKSADPAVARAVAEVAHKPVRPVIACRHEAPATFKAADALPLAIATGLPVASVRLWYRHVNQGERFDSVDMTEEEGAWRSAIPAAYTDSSYPLQYYFELRDAPDRAWLYPGLGAKLADLPYFVVRMEKGAG